MILLFIAADRVSNDCLGRHPLLHVYSCNWLARATSQVGKLVLSPWIHHLLHQTKYARGQYQFAKHIAQHLQLGTVWKRLDCYVIWNMRKYTNYKNIHKLQKYSPVCDSGTYDIAVSLGKCSFFFFFFFCSIFLLHTTYLYNPLVRFIRIINSNVHDLGQTPVTDISSLRL